MKVYEFPIIIEKDEEGFFVADCPSLEGCHTQGETYKEALANIREVVELHIEDRKASGEKLPKVREVSLTTLEVTA